MMSGGMMSAGVLSRVMPVDEMCMCEMLDEDHKRTGGGTEVVEVLETDTEKSSSPDPSPAGASAGAAPPELTMPSPARERANRDRRRSKDERKATLTEQTLALSARAVTYCDVLCLRMTDLHAILERDIAMTRRLSRPVAPPTQVSVTSGMCAARWIGKLRNRTSPKVTIAAPPAAVSLAPGPAVAERK